MSRLASGCLVVALAFIVGAGTTAGQEKDVPLYRGKSALEWAKLLKDKDLLVRMEAVVALPHVVRPTDRELAPALIEALRDKELEGFGEFFLAQSLARLGAPVVPLLGTALKDPMPSVRRTAALALTMVGADAKPAAPALHEALKDPTSMVRMLAATALGQIGPDAREAIPTLRRVMEGDRDPEVRVNAALALWKVEGQSGPTIETLSRLLQDTKGKGPVAAAAAQGLGHIGREARAAVPLLRDSLREGDVGVRRGAAFALGQMSTSAGAAQADLRRAVEDWDVQVRWWAALAILALDLERPGNDPAIRDVVEEAAARTLGPRPSFSLPPETVARIVKPLIAGLARGNDLRLRQAAARLLSLVGAGAKDAIPALLICLNDPDDTLRRLAADALGSIGEPSLSGLLRILAQDGARSRAAAARALGRCGPAARKSAAVLEPALQDKDEAVRVQAALAYARLEGRITRSLPVLIAVLDNKEGPAREEAVEALGLIGLEVAPDQQELTAALARSLKDADARVRVQAIRALWRMDRQPRVVVPLLRPLLADKDPAVRQIAVEVLGELGPEGKPTSLLLEALADREPAVRRLAIEGLGRLGDTATVPLTEALAHTKPEVRAGAAEALGRGAPQDDTVAALRKAIGDADEQVSKQAERALRPWKPDLTEEEIRKAREQRGGKKPS